LQLEFPWEDDNEIKRAPSKEEMKKLKEQGRRFAEMLNKKARGV
jgi:hypothetical protein